MSEKDVKLIRGVVLDSSRLSHTEVWSSGGGGYVGPQGGRVHAPTVHSQSITNTDVFIQDAQGKEHLVRIHDHDIPTRAGHDLELAYVRINDSWYLAGLMNHTLDRYWLIPCNVRTPSEKAFWIFWSLVWVATILIGLGGILTSCAAKGETALIGFGVAIASAASFWLVNKVTMHYEYGPMHRTEAKAKKALRINDNDSRS